MRRAHHVGAGVLAGVFWSLELVGRARSWVELELECVACRMPGAGGPLWLAVVF